RAIERQVVEAYVDQKAEARDHGAEQGIGDGSLARGELERRRADVAALRVRRRLRRPRRRERLEETPHVPEREAAHLGAVPASEPHGQRLGTEATTLAGLADARDQEAADLAFADRGVVVELVGHLFGRRGHFAFRVEALETGDDALVSGRALLALAAAVGAGG